ncbi:methyltransferase [Streptacidiphilus sp. PB12-B1b]|nr:methyltransferase [Streptacidiphilus sp. PB12-B1b]QMU79939.1 methyltransferase [Streptacidiphilus sp. PB12-B1b]
MRPAVDAALAARLRAAFVAADFTADGCLDLLGAPAYAALARSETVPALRATGGGTARETLLRLFLLQRPVPYAAAEAAGLPVQECLADGWLTTAPGEAAAPDDADPAAVRLVRATVDIRPYANDIVGTDDAGDAWIVSDLGCSVGGAGGIGSVGGVPRAELVLGVGGASTTLANITVRRPVRRVLDVGTGSGVQALHAARHGAQVVATDVNARALHFTRLTAALSGLANVETRQGSLFEPVGEETFDLIVSNPPFVISPAGRFTYRDGGMAGDDLCAALVAEAGRHLEPGGYCQLLANWQHVRGEDWRARLSGWIQGTGCDAWVIQREVQDVFQYAELWLRDGGDHREDRAHYDARYQEWLDAFEAAKVEGVGFGWITLRRAPEGREPVVLAEEWPHPVEQPLGPEVERWFARQDFLRDHDDAALLAARYRLADEVVQEQIGVPGAEDPEHVVLRQNRGMRRATKVDTVGAGFAGACDGSLPAGAILDAIAQLVQEDPVGLRDRTPQQIRMLVEQGFLVPVALD